MTRGLMVVPGRGGSLALALAGLALAACRVAGPELRSFVGPVAVVNTDVVCIGGPNASGECFVHDKLTKNLGVDDCVRVTYALDESPGPSTASDIQHLEAATHPAECPSH